MAGEKLDLRKRIWYAPFGMGRWRAALRLTGVGWYIGLCIFLGVWGGLWIDGRFGTKPFFLIGGLVVGLAVALFGVYRMIRPLMNNIQDKENG